MDLFALYFDLLLLFIELFIEFWTIFDVKNIYFYIDMGKRESLNRIVPTIEWLGFGDR